jgi:hypothetical protein
VGWETEECGSILRWDQEIFLFFETSRPGRGYTQPAIRWIPDTGGVHVAGKETGVGS